ncbi:MAG TPA: hypothetical protein VJN18_19280 [Polyangiaceae bacterium]|nr:hypothetical protein [Polyangiaceae bacterium]
MTNARFHVVPLLLLAALSVVGCDDDDEGPGLSPAQLHGVGAACDQDRDCFVDDMLLTCLSFKGGYCGLEGCQGDADCPPGSACVTHDDGVNYCFLICTDKPQCNYTRPVEIEANCVSSIDFVDGANGNKACAPPS